MQCICSTDTIGEGESRGFELGGLAFFIIRRNDQFYAYLNSCPHRGIELNWQPDQFLDIEGQLIQCGTHGALFLIDSGLCVAGPCINNHLKPIPIQVLDHHIWLV